MKAVVCTRYGPPEVLQLREHETPIPKDNEVLIRVRAATVMAGDCQLRSMSLPLPWQPIARIGFGFRGPRRRILGQELSGVVETVGRNVRKFKPGDEIFAGTGLHLGAYAEFDCLSEKLPLATKPSNMSFEEAACVPAGGLWSLPIIRKGDIRSGQEVLVIGAAGATGNLGLQLAKYYGANVTAVDSTAKLDMLRSIGADHVVDFTKADFSKRGAAYDIIFDAVGKNPVSACLRSLKQGGTLLLGNPAIWHLIRSRFSFSGSKRVMAGSASYTVDDLVFLKELIEAGRIRSVIDRRYPLEETAEAHRYVDTGRKAGNVVITVGHNGE